MRWTHDWSVIVRAHPPKILISSWKLKFQECNMYWDCLTGPDLWWWWRLCFCEHAFTSFRCPLKNGLQFLRGNSRVFKRNVGRKLGKHKAHDLGLVLGRYRFGAALMEPGVPRFRPAHPSDYRSGILQEITTQSLSKLSSNPNSSNRCFSREFLKTTKSMRFFCCWRKTSIPPTPQPEKEGMAPKK